MPERQNPTEVLAFVLTFGFFGVIAVLLFHEVPETSRGILGPLIGAVGGAVGTIVGYKWGSSSGSAAKSDTIAALTGTGDGGKVTNATSTLKTEVTTVTTPDKVETPPKEEPPANP
jgi:hypothetical protein